MVIGADVGGKGAGQKKAQQRHQRLKAAEIDATDQAVLQPHIGGRQPLGDGHREGVHGKGDGCDDQIK